MKDFLELDVRRRPWPSTRVIDVTLRDGGFRNRFAWTIDDMATIASAARDAGVSCIELGYVGGVPELHGVRDVGLAANLSPDHVARLRMAVPTGLLAAMVHPSAAPSALRLAPFADAGLNMVRLIYHRRWKDRFAALAAEARDAGLLVSANIALASRYPAAELVGEAGEIAGPNVDILYFADTCAALLPSETAALARALSPLGTLGFHGHDFLSLALANALAAASAGVSWIDASLHGIGRGAGNLRLELWLTLMAASTGSNQGCLSILLPALQLVEQRLGPELSPDMASIVAGALNLTPPQEDQLRDAADAAQCAERAAMLLQNHLDARSVAQALAPSRPDMPA